MEDVADDFMEVFTADGRRERAPGATWETGRTSLLTSRGDSDDVHHSEVQALFSRQWFFTLAEGGVAWYEIVLVNLVFGVQFDAFDVGHGLLL